MGNHGNKRGQFLLALQRAGDFDDSDLVQYSGPFLLPRYSVEPKDQLESVVERSKKLMFCRSSNVDAFIAGYIKNQSQDCLGGDVKGIAFKTDVKD